MDDVVGGNFITKILGEMKNQFNNKNEGSDAEDNHDQEETAEEVVHRIEPENGKETSDDSIKEDDVSSTEAEEQTQNATSFRKPEKAARRPRRSAVHPDTVSLKRSTRRRSKDCGESVLQSAIARKEKSYNETNKPQRLTRQLKPTQKILDNIASAAALKQEKRKEKGGKMVRIKDDSDEDSLPLMFSERKNKLLRSNKKLKTSHLKEEKDNVEFKFRRSDRFNSNSNNSLEDNEDENEDKITDVENDEEEEPSTSQTEVEESSSKQEILASRLCLCTSESNIYGFVEGDEELFCMALDSIGCKTVGCNNSVNLQKTPMIRPSTKIPYNALCNLHYKRMLCHNCCPSCGLFCTQGKFVMCLNKHYYHKDCHLTISGSNYCPHCGDPNPPYNVEVSMTTPEPPLFSTTQKSRREFDDCDEKVNGDLERECPSPPIIPIDGLRLNNGVSCKDSEDGDVKDLLESIKAGDCERLAAVIAAERINLLDLISYDGEVGTALHFAAKHGVLPVLHVLKMANMDLDVLDGEQNTALMTAVTNFQNEVVRYLTGAGASVTTKGTDGMTAIHLAAKCGNLEVSKILLSSACHIKNYINLADDGGWTPLVWACHHNHVEIVKYLLCEGADPLLMDVEENVALHWAAFGGSSKTVELILNFGGKVDVVNSHGDTPLHIAARQDNYNCVLILLARGAKIDAVNKLEETPIDCCSENGKSFEVLSLNHHLQSFINISDKQVSYLSNDIAGGKEENTIPCINEMDDEQIPTDYVYITKNCVTSNISIDLKITTLKSCTCGDRCSTALCSCGLLSSQCWYDHGRLTQEFNYEDPPMIFECNQVCSCCATSCNNRVVQKGALQKFQLFRTNSKGWGIRASKSILCGTYVSEYVGELITDTEADRREDDSYLFDLDNRDVNTYCIDAKFYGNFTRFINHSCNPNLVPVRVFIDHQDIKFPRIALFANRDIAMNEELSFDYGEKFWIIKYKYFTCECESTNCRYSKENITETLNNYYSRLSVG